MGLADRIKSFFTRKPKSENTEQSPQAFAPGFRGSYGYTSDSGGAKWPNGLSADGRIRQIDHFLTRQNVRDLVHESLDARAVIERMADSVVDTGLILEAVPVAELLGISPEEAETWSRDVERRFHMWASDKKQHRSQNLNFYQAQRLYEFMQQRDNDVFTRLYYSGSRGLQNPVQFDFIDANQIRGYAWTSTYLQSVAGDGINRNADGSEKSYQIYQKDVSMPGAYKPITIPRIGEKSRRVMMLHGFTQEYAGQGRGFPRLMVAIQDLENLTDFSAAAIKKAINQSNLVLSVENQQQDPGNPFEGISPDQNTSAVGAQVQPLSPESQEVINRISSVEVCPLPEAGLDTPGSTAIVGNSQGDTIRMLETRAPADNFKEFVGVFAERLSAALSIPVEVVLMKFGQNYSASRATLLLFWRIVEMWRQEMAIDWLNPIYESWLREEIAAGRIQAPGFSDPVLRAAWLNCQWIGSPLPSIDPKKEADARRANLEMSLTTVEREARNLNGSDAMGNISKNASTFPKMPSPYWAQSQPADESMPGEESEE